MGESRLRRILSWAVRVVLSLVCLWLVLRQVDIALVGELIGRIGALVLLAGCALHLLILLVCGWRWRRLMAGLGASPSLGAVLGLTMIGTLLNLILPFAMGGDAGRVLLGPRQGVAPRVALISVLADRLTGLQALGVLALIGALLGGAAAIDPLVLVVILATVPAAAIVFWLRIPETIGEMRHGWRPWLAALRRPVPLQERHRGLLPLLAAVGVSLPAHALAVAIMVLYLATLGYALPVAQAMVIFPGILLAAALPVSIGGWGVRELAAVSLLAHVGVPAAAATSVAVAFALSQMAVALLGSLAWLLLGRPAQKAISGNGG
jgi:uncharacterized membrane protein YbhN (UPF0104 family)